MKKLLLSLLLFPIAVFAQIKFEPGYFIDNNGTKTECLIRNIGWKNNPKSFDYKQNETASSLKNELTTVSEFSVGSYHFKRFTVNIDRSSNDVSEMSNEKQPVYVQETVYLLELVSGNATLYKYEDGNLLRFFYSKDGLNPEQLVYKPYKADDGIAYNSTYKGQLYRLMNDKIKDNELIKKTNCSERELTKLFLKYNGQENLPVTQNTETKHTFNFRVVAGAGLITTKNTNRNLDVSMDMDAKITPQLGFEAEWVLPVNRNKWSVFVQPYYQSYSQTGSTSRYEGISTEYYNWDIKYTSIDVPLGIKHHFFLNAGSKISLSLAYLYSFKLGNNKVKFSSTSNFSEYQNQADITNSSGLMAGLAYHYKNAGIEMRYYFQREIMNNYAFWGSKYSGTALLLNYKIF
ncbi:hypothetical protein ACLI1A_04825 [Flavobacterium sp. RHBU_3]|uniref:hypothetical protein n=1 Tax=Flavobacterium sp. RHBU_3 TaxID=3391184 RepID=UPI00398560E3